MYTGRPGSGKTYSLVIESIKLLNKGNIVYSNFKINWNGYEEKKTWWKKILIALRLKKKWHSYPKTNLRSWDNFKDILEIKNGWIVMDEAHFYFNSRKWKEMPFEFMRKLAQHRKDGIHIIGTVQNIKRVDVLVRELIDFWYDCRKLPFFISVTEYDVDEDQMRRFPIRKKFFLFSKKKASRLYDTMEKIGS